MDVFLFRIYKQKLGIKLIKKTNIIELYLTQ
jgi:hypothetical protein